MDPSVLEKYGLTKNESRVYLALVQAGKLKAGEAAKNSGVPYGKIYSVLFSLEKKRFLKVFESGNVKHFIPNHPRATLSKRVDELKNEAKSLEDGMDSIIDEMADSLDHDRTNDFVKIIEGRNSYQKFSIDLHKKARHKWFSINHLPITKSYFDANVSVLENRSIDARILAIPHKNLNKNMELYLAFKKKIRVLLKPSPRFTLVDDDEVVIRMNEPGFKNYISIWIHNKSLNSSLTKVFLEMWKKSTFRI